MRWIRALAAPGDAGALVRNIAWHLTDRVALRGAESTGEGRVDRALADLRALRDQL